MPLNTDVYLAPSAGGAFYFVCNEEDNEYKAFLDRLLRQHSTPPLTREVLEVLTEKKGDAALAMLRQMQARNWVEGIDSPRAAPEGNVDLVAPDLLAELCDTGRAVLADADGLCISSYGLLPEAEEELSAVSARIGLLYQKHKRLFQDDMGFVNSAWGIIDAAGNSQLGFWPVYIGHTRFVLGLEGIPRFNTPALVDLVWALNLRYSRVPEV